MESTENPSSSLRRRFLRAVVVAVLALGSMTMTAASADSSSTTTTSPATSEPTTAPSTAAPATTTPATTAAPARDVQAQAGSEPTVQITKTAAVPGDGLVRPGTEFTYQLYLACTSTEVDCPGFVFTDVIPPGLDVVQLPQSNPTRTVAYDAATRTLTMTYQVPTDNPAGLGWPAGSNEAFDLVVRLSQDTDHQTGDQITNEGVISLNGVPKGDADATVTVDVPVAVTPVASKQWPGADVVAGSDATTVATIGAANASSTSSKVTSLGVVDTSAATWEHFDLTTATLTALPQGATQAQLFVCTQAGSVCGDDDWIAGGTAAAPGLLSLPSGVAATAVTGVRVEFTADGAVLPRAPEAGGTVDLGLELRDTFRSSGVSIDPASPITVHNCAVATASEASGDPVTSTPSCADKQILPSTLSLKATKTWVPDTDGNWTQDSGEHAVAGAQSPVTASIRAVNQSLFPIHQVVVSEPAPGSNFDDFDVDQVRLTFPSGATTARVQVTYTDGTTTDDTYSAAQTVALGASTTKVTSVVVTYTGGTTTAPTIAAGATAGLDLHGHLTAAVATATTLTNCADVTTTGADGTTPASARPCGNLTVEAPNVSGQGVKTSSQSTIPPNQPVTFTLRLTNNGNLALVDPVVTDPTDPTASPNPFDDLILTSATATSNQPGSPPLAIEVRSGGTWQAYNAANIPTDVTGVRVDVDGDLSPTRWVQLNLTVERRSGVASGVTVKNCFGATVGNDGGSSLTLGANACVSLTTGDASGGATLAKDIAATQLPQWTPGLTRQQTPVTLRVANTGNLSAQYLQLTDDDTDFFDAVDFVGFGSLTAPAGANRVTIDAFVNGAWVAGTPTVVGSPTLPTGVAADQVRGLRVTFSSTDTTTNGGFVLPPCTGVTAGCSGVVGFVVSPRPALVSDPDTPPPSPLSNTVQGTYLTNVDGGQAQPIDPATDTLALVSGDPKLDVAKGPKGTVLGPGSSATQTIAATNNGTTPLPDASLVDALPTGLAFDELFSGADGPYTVAVTGLPDGYAPAPSPAFALTRDGEHVQSVRWTFAGWSLPPNATITITFQVGLEPGVTTGQTITNTMGATADTSAVDKPLACTSPDGTAQDDPRFGDGIYCTDTAATSVIAGAAFQARKWVAGDASLGWWHPTLGFVPTGDSNCPSIDISGTLYTATPCVALVSRGGQYDYVLRIVNAGTEPATRMALVDNLPYQGDSGLVGGLARGTEWDNRPTLAGPAAYTGPGDASISYSSATPGTWCTDDLDLAGSGCASGWSDGAAASTTAIRLIANFAADALNPGAGIELHFTMDVPTEIAQDSDVTIAWNSFAHAEATRTAQGGERILPAIEPIKVGVSPMLQPTPPPTIPTQPTTPPAIAPNDATLTPVSPANAANLAWTGSNVVPLALLGAGLLAAGAIVLVTVRRRRAQTPE
jgi:uncharacterized repeat protein (TIGR01451 family)